MEFSDGFLDNDDMEFMYGLRHVYAKALSKVRYRTLLQPFDSDSAY